MALEVSTFILVAFTRIKFKKKEGGGGWEVLLYMPPPPPFRVENLILKKLFSYPKIAGTPLKSLCTQMVCILE